MLYYCLKYCTQLYFDLGIEISNNERLNNLPSNIFANAKTLQSFRLTGNFGLNNQPHKVLVNNLLDPLEKLKDLRVIGTMNSLLRIPPDFLRNSYVWSITVIYRNI